MRLRSKDGRDSLIGLLAIVIVVTTVTLISGKDNTYSGAEDVYRISAFFNRIDGLFPGDTVTLSGIPVGVVEKTSLDERFRAKVIIQVDASVVLPEDTSIAIHTDGLFGSKFVVLEPGGEDELLRNGDNIAFTQDAMIVSDLLDLIIAEGRSARIASENQQK